MKYLYFFLVVHSGSAARLDGKNGITLRRLPERLISFPPSGREKQQIYDDEERDYARDVVEDHVDPDNGRPTGLIRTIKGKHEGDRTGAEHLANWLVDKGKTDVIIHDIQVPLQRRHPFVEFRNLRGLMENLGLDGDSVWGNNVVFLNRIPAEYVVRTKRCN
ncbi:hypothetical protein IMZ48_04370 [Candidatus Bathyarchaeota archaeon]|nr:hypothetical protein [Candidatus Bathyarchaeota archaeon]